MKPSITLEDAHNELLLYTLEHAKKDPSFIHQYVVDAWAAQTADTTSKPIGVAFALIGLYLYIEKNYSGRDVQLAHIQLAQHRKQWPVFDYPTHRGEVTVLDVIVAPPSTLRDAMIRKWCASVWEAWKDSHTKVAKLAQTELGSWRPQAD